jgi:protein O-mannosyl-transferase
MDIDKNSEKKRNALFCVFLAVAVFSVYAVSLRYPFLWDDDISITKNPGFGTERYVRELFTGHFFNAGLESKFVAEGGFYRPIVGLSFIIDRFLWGMNAYGFRLTNILLHIFCTILLYFMMKRLSVSGQLAMLLSFLYGIHPVHIGSVAYISGRTDILRTLFMILGLFSWWDRKKGQCLIFFLLSLLSKEDAIVLPGVIMASDLIIDRRFSKGSLWLVLLGFAYVLFRKYVLAFSDSFAPGGGLLYIGTVVKSAFIYLRILVFPFDLHFERFQPLLKNMLFAVFYIALFLFLLTYAVRHLYKQKAALFAFCSFFLIFLPVSNLIPVYRSFRGVYIFMADHFLYMPLMFLCVLLGLLLSRKDIKSIKIINISALLTIYLLVFFFQYIAQWRDTEFFYKKICHRSLFPYRAYNNLAAYYEQKGDSDCLLYLEKLKKIMPGDYEFYYVIKANWYYFHEKNIRKAIETFEDGLRNGVKNKQFYFKLGLLYFELGDKGSIENAEKNFLIYNEYYKNNKDVLIYFNKINNILKK